MNQQTSCIFRFNDMVLPLMTFMLFAFWNSPGKDDEQSFSAHFWACIGLQCWQIWELCFGQASIADWQMCVVLGFVCFCLHVLDMC